MKSFLTQCQEDIHWRTQEIALIRKSTVLLGASEEIREVLRRYAVPALYAVWEGFVLTTLAEFAIQLNKKHLLLRRVHYNIVRHDAWERFNLANLPFNREKQASILSQMCRYFRGYLELKTEVHTNSNVDYKELCRLMTSFGVVVPDEIKYKGRLAKFLNIRCCIAHGNNKLSVTEELIKEFADLVTELMGDIVEILDGALKNKLYLGNSLEKAFLQ